MGRLNFTKYGYNIDSVSKNRQASLNKMADKYDTLMLVKELYSLSNEQPNVNKANKIKKDAEYVRGIHQQYGGIYEVHNVDGHKIEYQNLDSSKKTLNKLKKISGKTDKSKSLTELSNYSYYAGIGIVVDDEYRGYCYYYTDPRVPNIINVSNYTVTPGYRSALRMFAENYFYRNNYEYMQVKVTKNNYDTDIWLNYWMNAGFLVISDASRGDNYYYMTKQLQA